ncbi:MAG: hypothetical protein ACRC10_02895 [Thermoguttaceae bacterium]
MINGLAWNLASTTLPILSRPNGFDKTVLGAIVNPENFVRDLQLPRSLV